MFQVRALTSEGALELLDRVEECARAAATATGTTVTMRHGLLYAEHKNNHTIASRTAEYLSSFGVEIEQPVLCGGTGSSDIGNVSLLLPAIHPYLKVAPAARQGTRLRWPPLLADPRHSQPCWPWARPLRAPERTCSPTVACWPPYAKSSPAGPDLPD
jgi:metal-dependent amidase/aminoacylase/carboxypeptidase family protein